MQGEGNLPPLSAELRAETQGRSAAEVCTQRSSRIFPSVVEEDWGYSLRARGAELLSVLGTCFTKQTGDLVYTMAENSWLSQLWLDA